MDALSDVLRSIRLSSAFYFKSDFSAPWGMNVPSVPFAQFHIVVSGQCLLQTLKERILLKEGDIVVFPHGIRHWIADSESSVRVSGGEVVESINAGCPVFQGPETNNTLVCGHFEFDRSVAGLFLGELPSIIHISSQNQETNQWLRQITDILTFEADNEMPGRDVIIQKLGEVLFIHTLRSYAEGDNHITGVFAALFHERISKALKVIHSDYAQNIQIEQLAKVSGMSRTNFINKFRALTGETPMNYVLQWRMLKASELLQNTEQSISQVAEGVGYTAEAAFIRIFKKRTNYTPLKYRLAKR
ncbi:AraC family transcriptional regulator [Roseivirga sp. E12]|uniref:AraC family transcriptional regulator n=1 Tax=Roseivirga sp. E12 TaxID=2819237 RepID=UPI001ABCA23E|nr:AraC family transcriptional regulator [Roseivirga sp. E12]MBO3698261.1 AraC family transcriptional regulator [Roseivirga sp. E12]